MEAANRRTFIRPCAALPQCQPRSIAVGAQSGSQFVNVAREAGLRARPSTAASGTLLLMETTGCGAAFFDYDQDGWLDIFPGEWLASKADGRRQMHPSADSTRTNDGTSGCHHGGDRAHAGRGLLRDFHNDGHTTCSSAIGAIAAVEESGQWEIVDVAAKARYFADQPAASGTTRDVMDYDRDGHPIVRLQLPRVRPQDGAARGIRSSKYKGLTVACGPPGRAEEHSLPQ